MNSSLDVRHLIGVIMSNRMCHQLRTGRGQLAAVT
jgi:hypothetical protein